MSESTGRRARPACSGHPTPPAPHWQSRCLTVPRPESETAAALRALRALCVHQQKSLTGQCSPTTSVLTVTPPGRTMIHHCHLVGQMSYDWTSESYQGPGLTKLQVNCSWPEIPSFLNDRSSGWICRRSACSEDGEAASVSAVKAKQESIASTEAMASTLL